MDFYQQAKAFSGEIIAFRRALHQIPETGLFLPKTAEYILNELSQLGLSPRTYEGHSGITADIVGGQPGPVRALRADMDGLPITEETGLSFASTNGAMHACGHDAHMAMLLGAARLLCDARDSLRGTVRLIFQPAEESDGGAVPMIRDGVLEGVEVIFGQHCGSLIPGLPAGTVAVRPGGMMASWDCFDLTVRGVGGHGAQPAECVDPVVVSAHIITALQTLISRECNATDAAVLTIGSLQSGEVCNIIPETALMKGALRCLDDAVRERLVRRIAEMAKGIAGAMGAQAEITFYEGMPPVQNDEACTAYFLNTARRLLGEERVKLLETPMMVCEDMAFFLQKCRGCFWFFSTPSQKGAAPHHNAVFDLDERVLFEGSALLAQAAFDLPDRY